MESVDCITWTCTLKGLFISCPCGFCSVSVEIIGESLGQWRNREAECPSRDLWPGSLYWPSRKREARKKWEKKRKIEKGNGEIGNVRRKSYKLRRGPIFFFFFFFFFLLFTFKNHWNLFKINQNGSFLPGKRFHYGMGKKIRKNDFAHQKNISVMPLHWAVLRTTDNTRLVRTHLNAFFMLIPNTAVRSWNQKKNWYMCTRSCKIFCVVCTQSLHWEG